MPLSKTNPKLWYCPQCYKEFYHDYGDEPCPHCKDPVTRVHTLMEHAPSGPHGFIQWKGTQVCMDFYCKCGASLHRPDKDVDSEPDWYVGEE